MKINSDVTFLDHKDLLSQALKCWLWAYFIDENLVLGEVDCLGKTRGIEKDNSPERI